MRSKGIFYLCLVYLAFLLCLLPVAIFTFKHPAHNWDMLAYMALIVRMDKTHSIDELHAITYSGAKQALTAEEYERLTTTPSVRKNFATDPSQFEGLLPMYAVKPLYIWTCWLFYKGGFSLTAATVMPSIISYLVIGLFLLYWLRKYVKGSVAFLGGLLIMLSIFTVDIAGLSTPDCLSALFLFLSAYFILEKRRPAFMFFFFLLSIYTRVDNIIACFFILSFLAFSEKWKMISKARYFLMVAILAIAYISIILPAIQPGWNLFYYSQFARQLNLAYADQGFSLSSYLTLVYSKLVTALVSSHFTFFLFLGLLAMYKPGISFRNLSFDQSFLLVLASVIFFRFLLLPDLSDRFYCGFYLVIIILLVRRFSTGILTVNNEDR